MATLMSSVIKTRALRSFEIWCFILTFLLCEEENDEEERVATLAPEAAAAPMDLDEVFGIGDDVDDDGGDDDGEPVRCLRRANALLSPSVLSCNLCTFTKQLVFGRGFDLSSFLSSAPTLSSAIRL